MIVSILIFFIIFGVIVMSHELGHFALARRGGIRVNEFDIGMGPTLVKWRRGETDFCLKLLPIGGACVFDGEDGAKPRDGGNRDEHSFPNASVWARMSTVIAGPLANFVLGYVFALVLVAFSGTDLPVVQAVIEDSAAQEAGILAGDQITAINGESIHLYREVSLISMMNDGSPMTITYKRDGEKNTVTLTPRYDEEGQRYLIGLQGGGQFVKTEGLKVFSYSAYEIEYWTRVTVKSIGAMFTGHFSLNDVSGPVGVVQVVDDTYEQASPYGISVVILSMLNLATLLTINLGIINLLPLPALDGGRLVFLLVEAVRGKPVPPEKEGFVHLAGFALLMALMVVVMFNDIARILHL